MGRKAKKDMQPPCCETNVGGYRVEAMVSVDERGQMVMPKELRDKIGIKAGDKLVVLSWQSEGEVCCISLIKADHFLNLMNDRLGPIMGELTARK